MFENAQVCIVCTDFGCHGCTSGRVRATSARFSRPLRSIVASIGYCSRTVAKVVRDSSHQSHFESLMSYSDLFCIVFLSSLIQLFLCRGAQLISIRPNLCAPTQLIIVSLKVFGSTLASLGGISGGVSAVAREATIEAGSCVFVAEAYCFENLIELASGVVRWMSWSQATDLPLTIAYKVADKLVCAVFSVILGFCLAVAQICHLVARRELKVSKCPAFYH